MPEIGPRSRALHIIAGDLRVPIYTIITTVFSTAFCTAVFLLLKNLKFICFFGYLH